MITAHRGVISSNLVVACQRERVLFSLLCSERLRMCCWAFGKEYDYDLSFVGKTLDLIAHNLKGGALPNDCPKLIDRLGLVLPSPDDYESALAAQARYGVEAVQNTLRLCLENNPRFGVDTASNVIDAIDNFEYFAWNIEPDCGPFTGNDDNWLLKTELDRQISDSMVVRDFNATKIGRLRIENRQFVVPAAIDFRCENEDGSPIRVDEGRPVQK